MSYNIKNYTEQGGDTSHIGGNVIFEPGFTITGLDAAPSSKGLVKQGVAVSDAAGDTPTATEFKALLDSLRDAGIIANPTVEEPDDTETGTLAET